MADKYNPYENMLEVMEQAAEKLGIIIRAFNEVWDKAESKDTTLRMGAYMLAIERIVVAKRLRGIFP